jgi:cardiolipin synthase
MSFTVSLLRGIIAIMHPTLTNIWSLLLIAYFITEWVIRIWSLFVIPVNRKPTSALGWLMIIMLFPVLGFIIFKVIGSPKLPAKRRQDQRLADGLIRAAVKDAIRDPKLAPILNPSVPKDYQIFESLAESLGHFPAFTGNSIEFIPNYSDVFKRMIRDVAAAQYFIHLEFYIIAWDSSTEPLLLALGAAVKRGVKVRLLFDQFGSRKYPGYDTLISRLEAVGAEVHAMLPVHLRRADFTRPDLRNHRKIGVIDGDIAYTGSLNIIEQSYHRKDTIYYDELVTRTTGPVVTQFEAVFLTDWQAESGVFLTPEFNPEINMDPKVSGSVLAQVLPSGPAYDTENNLKLFGALIHSAIDTITIVNPYFVPDESLMIAITSAANRGVRVRLINSAVSDQFLVSYSERSYYAELLSAGVEIYLYKAPILLHTKTITVDNKVAIIGSSNFDIRSFTLNLEVTLIAYDSSVVANLQKIEDNYLLSADRVELESWATRGWRQRLFENLARLTSAVQ